MNECVVLNPAQKVYGPPLYVSMVMFSLLMPTDVIGFFVPA